MAGGRSQAADQALSVPKSLPTGMLPCFGCGYDLRGSPPRGLCPDCGQRVPSVDDYYHGAREHSCTPRPLDRKTVRKG